MRGKLGVALFNLFQTEDFGCWRKTDESCSEFDALSGGAAMQWNPEAPCSRPSMHKIFLVDHQFAMR